MFTLELQNHQEGVYVPSENQLKQWAMAAYRGQENASVSLRVVDRDESQTLNNEYRHKNKPTNVLSFPMEMPEELLQMLDVEMLGDLVVCAAVVADEAIEQHKNPDAHWAHMIVHGMLHLQGYDHIDDAQAEDMEALEIEILNRLGFANPYLESPTDISGVS